MKRHLVYGIILVMSKAADIQAQLRQALLDPPVSRRQIALAAGVSEGVVSNFVNGHRSITMDTAARLARVLGLELRPVRPRRKGG